MLPDFDTKQENTFYSVTYAEYCAEMVEDSETKKEENYWWEQYRNSIMIASGDKNLFNKICSYTHEPSKKFFSTLSLCACGENHIKWKKGYKKYEMLCDHNSALNQSIITVVNSSMYEERACYRCNNEFKKQKIGIVVMFLCPICGVKTDRHFCNSDAKNEWNKLQNV